MTDPAPIICWLRRDLRLGDNPMLAAAAATGRPLIPVFIHDAAFAVMGAAPKWRLGEAVGHFARTLQSRGTRLVLRRGPAVEVLRALVAETGARSVWWGRLYDPDSVARDTEVKRALTADGVEARSFAGHLLFEPWDVATGQGAAYRVYTPFWRAVKDREVPSPQAAPATLPVPGDWPVGEALADWRMGAAMGRGAAVVANHITVGEAAAQGRLGAFIAQRIGDYAALRDRPGVAGTSGLSENLTYGEIGPRTVWHAAMRALHEGAPGAETFLKELVWREFAWHLIYHTPRLADANWRPEWDGFPWRDDNDDAEAWRRGRTGVPMVDAAMRELYVTGHMHNRARMIAASFLTKHLLTHWKVGRDWFAECLIDWDPASNALGWQWVAGSGPDAAPYFRIFNPETQSEKFDPQGTYRHRFVAELSRDPPAEARAFFEAAPRNWGLSPDMPYPDPVIALRAGRERALAAYQASRGTAD